jgi:hypothetical protein
VNELNQAFDIGILLGMALFIILAQHGVIDKLLIWLGKNNNSF